MLQVKTKTGLIEATDDTKIITSSDKHDHCYDHAKLVIHGPNGGLTLHPIIMLYDLDEASRLDEIARTKLAYTDEFPIADDIFTVPIQYAGDSDYRVVWYSV